MGGLPRTQQQEGHFGLVDLISAWSISFRPGRSQNAYKPQIVPYAVWLCLGAAGGLTEAALAACSLLPAVSSRRLSGTELAVPGHGAALRVPSTPRRRHSAALTLRSTPQRRHSAALTLRSTPLREHSVAPALRVRTWDEHYCSRRGRLV